MGQGYLGFQMIMSGHFLNTSKPLLGNVFTHFYNVAFVQLHFKFFFVAYNLEISLELINNAIV